jgi:heptosyltransferase-2
MEKILFIKLGALGGVLRATPFFTGLKEKYPSSQLNVLTKSNALDLLKRNKCIDNLWIWEEKEKDSLKKSKFDWIINTEDDAETCDFVKEMKTLKFTGPYKNENNKISYTNDSSIWYDMGKISKFGLEKANELKKQNQRTYQDIYSEILELPRKNYSLVLNLTYQQEILTKEFRRKHNLLEKEILVGVNTGAGTNWPLKSISIDQTAELIKELQKKNLEVVLLGGHNERERNLDILNKLDYNVINASTENTLSEYISIINSLNVLVTSDTLALHIATALKKRIVSFFGPTSAEEIELYGQGVKIKPDTDCYCCFQKQRIKSVMCIDKIQTKDILNATLEQIRYRNK